ncbi:MULTISPECIES: FAD binding domain-containing protein [Paraburkholderia]|uniref:FAD binding domain-containing protein n=1 Tax=Paraburkholderia metrosideri TaxID=580937 RepID=A0ABW9E2G6_9BURK
MKPAPFKFVQPADEDAVVAALAEYGDDACLLAGGQSLVPMMNFRIVSPAVLIDLNVLPTLDFVRSDGDILQIGALTRHAAVEDSATIASTCPLLRDAARHVAHRTVRHRGTLGGTLALAYPGAEMPLALVALGAEVELRSTGGARTTPVADFIQGGLDTTRKDDEYIRSVRVHVPPVSSRSSFVEVSRRHGDFAIAAAAVVLDIAPDGRISFIRAAVAGGTGAPRRLAGLESALLGGRALGSAQETSAIREAVESIEIDGDPHYPEAYRRHLLNTVLRRAFANASHQKELSDASN